MGNKEFEFEFQLANVINTLAMTTQIQEKMMVKLEKLHDEVTYAKGWFFGLVGIFGVMSMFFDFKHLVHF